MPDEMHAPDPGDDIGRVFDQDIIEAVMLGRVVAFSRRTGLEIGPVLDIRAYEGRCFALIDIDRQMVFFAKLRSVQLRVIKDDELHG